MRAGGWAGAGRRWAWRGGTGGAVCQRRPALTCRGPRVPHFPSPLPRSFVFIIFSLVLAAGWAAVMLALRWATRGERAAGAAARAAQLPPL